MRRKSKNNLVFAMKAESSSDNDIYAEQHMSITPQMVPATPSRESASRVNVRKPHMA